MLAEQSPAKSPFIWTSKMVRIISRYFPTSTTDLSLLLSTSRCQASLHLCSPSTEPGSGGSSGSDRPSSPSFLSHTSNDTHSLSDSTSSSRAKANTWAALWLLVLTGRMEQDAGRNTSSESKNWSICKWLQGKCRETDFICYYIIHVGMDLKKKLCKVFIYFVICQPTHNDLPI